MDGWGGMNGAMGGEMDGGMNGWKDGEMDAGMEGWVDYSSQHFCGTSAQIIHTSFRYSVIPSFYPSVIPSHNTCPAPVSETVHSRFPKFGVYDHLGSI